METGRPRDSREGALESEPGARRRPGLGRRCSEADGEGEVRERGEWGLDGEQSLCTGLERVECVWDGEEGGGGVAVGRGVVLPARLGD